MLDFLYTAVSWVLLRWHDLFVLLGFSETSGLGWVLSIVFLVITARVLLFRLFIKQVHYQRNMQKMQPKMKKIREKYKNDKQEMNRQLMKFQQEEGFNPLSGCLPMLLQIPVFIGLYHSLRHLANSASQLTSNGRPRFITIDGQRVAATLCNEANGRPGPSHLLSQYSFTPQQTCDGAKADLFGAPLAASFRDASDVITQLGGDATTTRLVILPLLVISALATFATQLLVRRSATTAPEGQAAVIQKFMLYVIPLGVMVSGLLFTFPLGVLLYWFTSNLWTLAQQAYILKFHPASDDASDEPTGQLGKTLAPKVGQRPQRPSRGGQDKVSVSKDAPIEDEAPKASGGAPPVRGSVPRPGQRPNRGKRPPAKKATQAKKRR